MRPPLSSFTSPSPPPSGPPLPSSFTSKPLHAKSSSPSSTIRIRSSIPSQEHLWTARKFGKPEPPWLPSDRPSDPLVSNNLATILLQLKRSSYAPRKPEPSADLGSVGKAVWSLASILEELQKSMIISRDHGETNALARVSNDTGDSLVWLFQRVFSGSPNLAIGLLGVTAEFLLSSVLPKIEEECHSQASFMCWSDIGILDETEKPKVVDAILPDYKRRRVQYEVMIQKMVISGEKPNSLILSNYAQLLYKYEKDFESAHKYFMWAVSEEPADGEAMSSYAMFLWHEKGDTERAEELFLQAMEADPRNTYYQSMYAYFLLKTGGAETCFPLY